MPRRYEVLGTDPMHADRVKWRLRRPILEVRESGAPVAPQMAAELKFTGERFVPGCAGEIAYEHWHRYAFARRFAAGKRTLDAACGEGYGTALVGGEAASAVGIDIDRAAIAHATGRYGANERIRFVEGSCTRLPFADASFDVAMSFETIEHLDAADQPQMLAEFARVLAEDGILIISSPNKRLYSDARGYRNEFHRHELYREDLARVLAPAFPAQRWHHQRVTCWSGIWPEVAAIQGTELETWLGRADDVAPYVATEGMYFIVVAARSPEALPRTVPYASLFTDADDSVLKRADGNAREVLRLDALLKERDVAVDQQTLRIKHFEAMVADQASVIGDMDRRLNGLDAELAQRVQSIAAQERIIAYRQTLRWWLDLPWLRVRHWLLGDRRDT